MAEAKIDPALQKALATVKYPGFETGLMEMGMIEAAQLGPDGVAHIKTRPITAPPEVREQLENAIAQALLEVPGVKELALEMPAPPKTQPKEGPKPIPGVAMVVPVASGKGGVGKSTLAVNLAVGLARQGLKVGLLDLDLYGPSIPLMTGLVGAQPQAVAGKLAPLEAFGVKVLSIGFMVDPEQALIWRGPLIMKAVRQLLHEVAWAPLDVLVLDLPPGTGDVQISMAQEVPVTGAVVVTTPQDVALADARKGVDMFQHMEAPVLGIVENMSYFLCPDCHSRHEIFGHGTVEPLCQRLGVDYLGEIPIAPEVRLGADQGQPIALGDSPAAQPYLDLAAQVAKKLEGLKKK